MLTFLAAAAHVIVPRKTRREWMKITCFATAAALAVIFGCATSAQAQVYPSRPVTIIVPFPAGGPTDTLGRILSERMRVSLGQPVVVENITGAGATIGVGRAVSAAPDGHTVVIGNWTSHVGPGAIYRLSYDVLTDLAPVSMISASPLMIVGKTGLPAKDGAELIAWLKANPNKASVATVGVGSAAHVCIIYFQSKTGTQFQVVPYRGGAPAMQDLVAGQIDLMCAEASQTLPFLRSGKMKGFARHVEGALAGGARGPDHGRGGRARHVHLVLERHVGSQRHAQGDHRQAQRRGGRRIGRSGRAAAAH